VNVFLEIWAHPRLRHTAQACAFAHITGVKAAIVCRAYVTSFVLTPLSGRFYFACRGPGYRCNSSARLRRASGISALSLALLKNGILAIF
jgi:hypothetical protein